MKVVMINGSARKGGNTSIALDTVGNELRQRGVETVDVEVGKEDVHGCIGCGVCVQKQNRRCVINKDMLNSHLETLFTADGMVIGSPVYYAGINGALKSFLDRAFFVGSANGALFRHKVGAAVVAVRRGGEVAAWEQINKYFMISEMFVPSSTYWNMVFGMDPGECKKDEEGIETMQVLGRNMAWLMDSLQRNKESAPAPVEKAFTNFIRD